MLREVIGVVKELKGDVKGQESEVGKKGQNKSEQAVVEAEGLTPSVHSRGWGARKEGKGKTEEARERAGTSGERRSSQERETDWVREMRAREARKKNLILKGWNGKGEGSMVEELEEWLEVLLGREVRTEELEEKRCGSRGKIIIVKLKKEDDVKEILEMKKEIEERERVNVDKDLTFIERRSRWCVRERIREKRRAGKEVTEEGEGWIKVVERDGNNGDEVTSRWRWDERQKNWEKMEYKVRRGKAEDKKSQGVAKQTARTEEETEKEKIKEKAKRRERRAKERAEIEFRLEELKREKGESSGEEGW